MIAPMPGAIPTKPGSATLPLPGIAAEVVTREGKAVGPNQGGLLIVRRPWPGMLRTIFRDPERYRQQYFSQIEGAYFTGDGARRDEDGYFWIMGRVDDVINVSGHRLGTMEIESALVSHPAVAEAAKPSRRRKLKLATGPARSVIGVVRRPRNCIPALDIKLAPAGYSIQLV